MIKLNSLTPELAEKIAGEVVNYRIAAEAGDRLRRMMTDRVREYLTKEEKKVNHDALFNGRDKSIAPFEKKFRTMLKRIWGEEEKILIANIKKMKKAWLHKDKIDDIIYPVGVFEKKLATGASQIFIEVMEKEGKRTIEVYDFDMIFDVQNPEVTK